MVISSAAYIIQWKSELRHFDFPVYQDIDGRMAPLIRSSPNPTGRDVSILYGPQKHQRLDPYLPIQSPYIPGRIVVHGSYTTQGEHNQKWQSPSVVSKKGMNCRNN